MPVASKAAILDEMAAMLRAAFVDELGTDDEAIQVEGRLIVNPTPVLASVDMYPANPGRGREAEGFGDLGGEYLFTVRARTTDIDDTAAQDILLSMADDASALSVPGILLTDPTLNGNATSLDIVDESGFQLFPPGNLVGMTWTVLVIAGES